MSLETNESQALASNLYLSLYHVSNQEILSFTNHRYVQAFHLETNNRITSRSTQCLVIMSKVLTEKSSTSKCSHCAWWMVNPGAPRRVRHTW